MKKLFLAVAMLVAAVSAEARISHGGVYNTSGIGHGGVFNPVLGPGGQQHLFDPGGTYKGNTSGLPIVVTRASQCRAQGGVWHAQNGSVTRGSCVLF